MIKKSPKGMKVLRNPTDPISIDRDRSVAGLLEKMESISFQGRNLATAHQLWLSMLSDNCTVFMGMAGALVAGGMQSRGAPDQESIYRCSGYNRRKYVCRFARDARTTSLYRFTRL